MHDDAPLGASRVLLAPLTTLGVGGPAAHLLRTSDQGALARGLDHAAAAGLPVFVLGGGSNLLVSDVGFPGLVVQLAPGRLVLDPDGTVTSDAGVSWETLVDAAVAGGFAGVECLTGIPGTVGAAPVQNIGAYGQEIADVLSHVTAWDRAEGRVVSLSREACGFGYRDSGFKRAPDRFIVLSVTLRLVPGGAPLVRYEELRRRVAEHAGAVPTLAEVRREVRHLRRGKAMLLDAETLAGPDARSAGSFFTNPVLDAAIAAALPPDAPRHPQSDGRVKVPAAWLIERSGVERGFTLGPAAVSTRHTLALVNRGGATAADLLALAAWVRRAVRRRFGVTLVPEPVFLGFPEGVEASLDSAERTLPN
jgi:UDP-N-acetylmuramate dehydrogenase